jgi:hypothetical protein
MEERNLGGVRLLFLRDSFFQQHMEKVAAFVPWPEEESSYLSNLKFSHQDILLCD